MRGCSIRFTAWLTALFLEALLSFGHTLCIYLDMCPLLSWRLVILLRGIFVADLVACADPDSCENICGNPSGCSDIAYPKLVIELLPLGKVGNAGHLTREALSKRALSPQISLFLLLFKKALHSSGPKTSRTCI